MIAVATPTRGVHITANRLPTSDIPTLAGTDQALWFFLESSDSPFVFLPVVHLFRLALVLVKLLHGIKLGFVASHRPSSRRGSCLPSGRGGSRRGSGQKPGNKDIPDFVLPRVGSEAEQTRATGLLCGFSFLKKRKDEATNEVMYDMHRLVQLAVRLWQGT